MKTLNDKITDIIINYNILDKLIHLTYAVLLLTAVIVFINAVSIKVTFGICAVLYFMLQYLELDK